MEQKISRRGFLRRAAAGTIGTAAFAMLSGCSAQKPISGGEAQASADERQSSAGPFVEGEYRSAQTTPFAGIEVVCTLSEKSLDSVTYEQTSTSEADYFPLFEEMMQQYCENVTENGRPEGVDGVTGATLCTKALRDGIAECMVQAMQPGTAEPGPLNPQVDDYRSFSGSCDHVFSPVKLGSMELPNRVIKSAGSSPWKTVPSVSLESR